MCDGRGVRAIPLHQRPDLLEPCADLVNSEWQRSRGARVHTLQKSCQEFPVALVLLQGSGNRDGGDGESLLGHVRLSRVVSRPGSLFVESVVVSKAQRGKGYGRTLMQETERYAKTRGFKRLCLTTHDKQHFYTHLGYVLSTPVQNAGVMGSFMPMDVLERFSRLPGTDDTQGEVQGGPPSPPQRPPSSVVPPPPPPPPTPSSVPPLPPLSSLSTPPSALSPPPPSCLPPPPPPPSIPPPPTQCPARLVVQTLEETPYRDAKGVPIFWMHKDI
ncbi:N-alpha-acetyltransferase 80 [Coregonus clupeaformis]|uniref:N-alpha-acetyltransferase 80 n=1 Tax=Coregonus clupeaformis TaxID=59861 RepID=UPI001BE00704|nr:N-alpha-acetyltransferase 80 [Coregonus clupeaformis]